MMDFKKAYNRVKQLMRDMENLPQGKTGDAKRRQIMKEYFDISDQEDEFVEKQKDTKYRSIPYFSELNDILIEFNQKYFRRCTL